MQVGHGLSGRSLALLICVLHSMLGDLVALLDLLCCRWRQQRSWNGLSAPRHTLPFVRRADPAQKALSGAGEAAAQQGPPARASYAAVPPTTLAEESGSQQHREAAAVTAPAAAAAADVGPVGHQSGPPGGLRLTVAAAYAPMLRLSTQCIELPGVQPEDLDPGCMERLRRCVEEQSGRYLVGCTVRDADTRGCTVTLDTVDVTSSIVPFTYVDRDRCHASSAGRGYWFPNAASAAPWLRRAGAAGRRRGLLGVCLTVMDGFASLCAEKLFLMAAFIVWVTRAAPVPRGCRVTRAKGQRERERERAGPRPAAYTGDSGALRQALLRPWWHPAAWAQWALRGVRRAHSVLGRQLGLEVRLQASGGRRPCVLAPRESAGKAAEAVAVAGAGPARAAGAAEAGDVAGFAGGSVTVRCVAVTPSVVALRPAPPAGRAPREVRFSAEVSACWEGGVGVGRSGVDTTGPPGAPHGSVSEALPHAAVSLRLQLRRGSQHVAIRSPSSPGAGPLHAAVATPAVKPCRRRACSRHLTLCCTAAVPRSGAASDASSVAPGLLLVDLGGCEPERAPKPAPLVAVDDPWVARELQVLAAAAARQGGEAECAAVLVDFGLFVQQAWDLRQAAAAALEYAAKPGRGAHLRQAWRQRCSCAGKGSAPQAGSERRVGNHASCVPDASGSPGSAVAGGHDGKLACTHASALPPCAAAAAAAAAAASDVCLACALLRMREVQERLLPTGVLLDLGDGLLRISTALGLRHTSAYLTAAITHLHRIDVLGEVMSGSGGRPAAVGNVGTGKGKGSAARGSGGADAAGTSGVKPGRGWSLLQRGVALAAKAAAAVAGSRACLRRPAMTDAQTLLALGVCLGGIGVSLAASWLARKA